MSDEKIPGSRPFASSLGRLALILLFATALRLVNLEGRALWYDEAFAVLYAEKPLGTILHGTLTPVGGAAADVHPLLYYFSLHFWMQAAGQSPLAVRLPSVLLGVATVALVYVLARELFDDRSGLWAAGLTAVAPFHVHYSQEARMYSLLCLLSLLAVYGFVRGWRRGGWANWALFTVVAALSLYAHNLAFLTLVALDLFVLLARRWQLIKPLIAAHAGIVLLFGPWLLAVPGQFGKVQQAYWVPRPGLAELFRTAMIFHFNLPAPSWLLPVVLFLSLAVPALVLYRLLRGPKRPPDEQQKWLLLLCLACLPVLLMFLVSQWKSIYIERGVIAAAVAYYVLVARVLAETRLPRRNYALLLGPLVLVTAVSLSYDYTFAEFPRPPFPELAAALRAEVRPGDAIVHSNKLTFLPAHYYDRTLPQSFIADPSGSGSDTLALPTQEALGLFATDLEAATAGHDRVWFVIFERAIAEYRAAGHDDHPHRAWLEARYRRQSETRFNDLILYLYVPGPGG
jgi:4-amino-4-deoxy-L-arabinose transferase-like glycosyltransferase